MKRYNEQKTQGRRFVYHGTPDQGKQELPTRESLLNSLSYRYYIEATQDISDLEDVKTQYYFVLDRNQFDFGYYLDIQSNVIGSGAAAEEAAKNEIVELFSHLVQNKGEVYPYYLSYTHCGYTALQRKLVMYRKNGEIVYETRYYVPYRNYHPLNHRRYDIIEIQGTVENAVYDCYNAAKLALTKETVVL